MADATEQPRIVLASVGVGVPLNDAMLFAGAVAATAGELGYRDLTIENDQVSARPPVTIPPKDSVTCTRCLRTIGRYPSGQLYRHHCTPPAEGVR